MLKYLLLLIIIIFLFIFNFIEMNYNKPPITNLKTAICLSSRLFYYKKTFKNINKYFIEPLKCDVFICIDGDELEEDIGDMIKLYKPKLLYINNNIQKNKETSMFYKIYLCNELKKQYEDKYNFVYDYVIRCRFDVFIFGYVNLLSLNKHYLNIPLNSSLNKIPTLINTNNFGITDMVAISNSKIMDIYSKFIFYLTKNNKCNVPEYKLNKYIQSVNIPIQFFNMINMPFYLASFDFKIICFKIWEKLNEDYYINCIKK